MQKLKFDLQLFAEEAPAEPELAGETAPAEGNAEPAGGSQQGTTILGGTGQQAEPQGQEGEGQQEEGAPTGAPEAYDFKSIVPEGMEYDESQAQAFGEIARKAGLSQEQASSIASYGMQYMQQGVNMAMQQIAAERQQWGEQARQELGANFDATVAKAAVGIDRLEQKVPGLRDIFDKTGAGNRIEMIRLMAAVGDLVGEDGGHSGYTAGGAKSVYPNTNFSLYD